MTYAEQTLRGLSEARRDASKMLLETGRLTLEETIVLQAISHLLLRSSSFSAPDVVDLTELSKGGALSRIFDRFEYEYEIVTSSLENLSPTGGRPRRVFYTTELGRRVLDSFEPPKKKKTASR